MKHNLMLFLLLSVLPFNGHAAAQDDGPELSGIKMGVGLSVTFDWEKRIESASVVNGIVRVDSEKNAVARILLESHYLFTPNKRLLGVQEPGTWGIGPFVGVMSGNDRLIEAAGIGAMLGFRRSKDKDNSFNIGVGYMVDPSSRTLGDGIIANHPLPQGESGVRYKTRSRGGIVVMASFSF
ncbi:hypothetical protein [Stenotrophomonas nitritireducens]|uniref:hypothetical protein n=1 Tax=Stenotrophomonas nitritireducens TaxID=83617 RepID=UPI003D9840AC